MRGSSKHGNGPRALSTRKTQESPPCSGRGQLVLVLEPSGHQRLSDSHGQSAAERETCPKTGTLAMLRSDFRVTRSPRCRPVPSDICPNDWQAGTVDENGPETSCTISCPQNSTVELWRSSRPKGGGNKRSPTRILQWKVLENTSKLRI